MAESIYGAKINDVEYSFEDETKVSYNLLKDTVGWTGKNLIAYPYTQTTMTNNGITFTDNGNGSVTINGTATAEAHLFISLRNSSGREYNIDYLKKLIGTEVILSGGISSDILLQLWTSGKGIIRDTGNGASFIVPSWIEDTTVEFNLAIIIPSGAIIDNLTIYPMLRKADIVDNTWEPYHKSVSEFTDIYIGTKALTTPMPAHIAKNRPILKRDISDLYYNGNLKSEIAAGNFINVRPGDYIVGKTTKTIYYIPDLDLWWHKGDKSNVTENPAAYTHHLCIMPYRLLTVGDMTPLWSGYGAADKSWRISANDKGRCPWQAGSDVDHTDTEAVGKNDTTGGYLNSYIKTYALQRYYNEWLKADFGEENVLKFRNWLSNSINTSKPSSGMPQWNGCSDGITWVDSYCDLPSEVNLYGSMVHSSSARDVGVQKEQLALFKQADLFDFYDRMDLWTKAVASSTSAATLNNSGSAYYNNTSDAIWVCPLAMIK